MQGRSSSAAKKILGGDDGGKRLAATGTEGEEDNILLYQKVSTIILHSCNTPALPSPPLLTPNRLCNVVHSSMTSNTAANSSFTRGNSSGTRGLGQRGDKGKQRNNY